MTWAEISERLSQPFLASAISWRAGSVSRDKKRAQALPYAEPRVYEDVLNEVLGPHWSCKFKVWGEQRIICDLSITVDGEVITRSSTGEFDSGDKIAQGTVAEAQAFKRACVKFGLGRYLYDLPTVWVDYDESSRKLTEVPRLPDKYLPSKTSSKPQQQAARAEKPEESPKADAEPKLSVKRADALHRELEKLGWHGDEQQKLAERALGHKVTLFSELTESEGLEVWNLGRKSIPKKDEPPFDPDPPEKLKDFNPHKHPASSRVLKNDEASNLHKILGGWGVRGKQEHYDYAAKVVEHEVKSFLDLSPEEAEKIYTASVYEFGSPEQIAEFEARKAAA